jgi:acyl-CoA reductase-like NAD-dependent aldehyde dehydrogenase
MGVVGCLVTLTYPVLMFCWKMCPAIAAGNTVVIKPSEYTSLTSLYCASLIREAGFPSGVVNVVTGFGDITGKALALHNVRAF